MEVYYKDLISADASLEKLVDDLSRVVQGAEEFAQAAAVEIRPEKQTEIQSRLQRLKEGCRRIREGAIHRAVATDRVLRKNPYSFAGVAFGVGLLAGALVCWSVCSRTRAKGSPRGGAG